MYLGINWHTRVCFFFIEYAWYRQLIVRKQQIMVNIMMHSYQNLDYRHYDFSHKNCFTFLYGNIFRVTGPLWGDSPEKGQWRGALMFFFQMCACTNHWANNRYAGDLRRHGAQCDVTVMTDKMYIGVIIAATECSINAKSLGYACIFISELFSDQALTH